MSIIDHFTTETPHRKSPLKKQNVLSLIRFVSLGQIPNIGIYHMGVSVYTEVIEGMQWLIATNVIESKGVADDDSIDSDGADLDKEDDNGPVEAGVITCVPEPGTEEVEEVHQDVKSSYLLSYILKPTSSIIQGFKENKNS